MDSHALNFLKHVKKTTQILWTWQCVTLGSNTISCQQFMKYRLPELTGI